MQTQLADLDTIFTLDYRATHWNIDHATGLFLSDFIMQNNVQKILEIGGSTGVSSCYFGLSSPDVSVTSIESNLKRQQEAIENWNKVGVISQITPLLAHAPSCLQDIESDYQLLFLDCIKLYYAECAKESVRLFSNLRYIIADNTISHHAELFEFVEWQSQYKSQTIDIGSGLTLITLE